MNSIRPGDGVVMTLDVGTTLLKPIIIQNINTQYQNVIINILQNDPS